MPPLPSASAAERTMAAVASELGDTVICGWCKATFATRGSRCKRPYGMACPGRQAISAAWSRVEQKEAKAK